MTPHHFQISVPLHLAKLLAGVPAKYLPICG
jgi:hypothetical protein